MRIPVYSALAGGLVAFAVCGTAAAKPAGMPQLDYHSFAPQLVWLVIAFVALYLVMSKLAVPAISDTLDKRQAKIQYDLDAAEKANEATRAQVAAYQKQLADAREEARGLLRGQAEADSGMAAALHRTRRSAERPHRRGREAHRRSARCRHGRAGADGERDRPKRLCQARRSAGGCKRARHQGCRGREGDQPMIGTAWAAGGADADHGGLFSEPGFWVAVAFFLFFALAGKILWKKITELLDGRAAAIAKALADAQQLRDDALKAKTDADRTLAQAAAEGGAILQQAREEAARMQAKAAANLETAVALREQQALDRIAQSEAQATKQVRDTAVDVALAATRALLREQVGAGRTQAMIDEAIGELPKRLH
jgi:F-type H+-transporting ATPase subunit b